MKDASSQLRSATRRAKSDVANKLISMFLHELSRKVSQHWEVRIGSEKYGEAVREWFHNRCPYCARDLRTDDAVIEHLDGMNRLRAGLHVPGNVLVACKRCNSEKRRDDSARILLLAPTGWESFLAHDGTRCTPSCRTCEYWRGLWADKVERRERMGESLERIRSFRNNFEEFQKVAPSLVATMPALLARLYSDCQTFAETEIKSLLEKFEQTIVPETHKRS
jgi:hypothetical protein